MDYGFAPGTTGQDRRSRQMFARRANTTLIQRRRIGHVRAFVQHLEATAARPIGDMLISSHANSSGQMQIRLFGRQRGRTTFETLEQTMAQANRSIAVSDGLIGHNAGDPITHDFEIKGCNVGKAQPFLQKFKDALGGHVNVSAPIHFHGLTFRRRYGVFEWMAYEFTVLRSTAFADRAAAVAGFQAAAQAVPLRFFDGTAIPANFWDTRQFQLPQPQPPVEFRWQRRWIPRRINRTGRWTVRAPLDPALGNLRTIPVNQQFRVERQRFGWTHTYPNAAAVPADDATRRQDVSNSISNDPRFSAAHDFPLYERWGYADFNAFFAGFTWRFRPRGRNLVATGTRHAYTVLLPIVDPATGNLVHNFYPNAGSPHPARAAGLVTTNAQFFRTV